MSVSNFPLPASHPSHLETIDHGKIARLTVRRIAANAELLFWLQWAALLFSLIAFVAAAVSWVNHIPTVS